MCGVGVAVNQSICVMCRIDSNCPANKCCDGIGSVYATCKNDETYDYLPSVEHALKGYNIYRGNPLTPGSLCDPGWASDIMQVFKLEHGRDGEYFNLYGKKYDVPLGFKAQSINSCEMESGTTMLSSTNGFKKAMSASIKLSGSMKSLRYKASASVGVKYSREWEKDSRNSKTTSSTSAKCITFSTIINGDIFPPRSDALLKFLENKQFHEEKDFYDLFDKAGTHALREARFGSKLMMKAVISEEDINSLETEERSVSSTLSGSMSGVFKMKVEADYKCNEIVEKIENFKSSTVTKSTIGSKEFSTMSEWKDKNKTNPEVIDMFLFPLCDVPEISSNTTKFELCMRSYKGHCEDQLGFQPCYAPEDINCIRDEDCPGDDSKSKLNLVQ